MRTFVSNKTGWSLNPLACFANFCWARSACFLFWVLVSWLEVPFKVVFFLVDVLFWWIWAGFLRFLSYSCFLVLELAMEDEDGKPWGVNYALTG